MQPPTRNSTCDSESGVALLLAIATIAILSAIGGTVVILAGTETRLASLERARAAARGFAELQLGRVLQDLARTADWNAVLSGAERSTFYGPTTRPRVPGWTPLDLDRLTVRLQAEQPAGWGVNTPRWLLYAHGAGADLLAVSPAATGSSVAGGYYTAAWIADDEADGDNDATRDANGLLAVRVEAYGPHGARQIQLATIKRRAAASIELLSLRTLR